MHDSGWGRSCATCRHETRIGERVPAACCDCIVGGACTRWEAGEAQTETGAAEASAPASASCAICPQRCPQGFPQGYQQGLSTYPQS